MQQRYAEVAVIFRFPIEDNESDMDAVAITSEMLDSDGIAENICEWRIQDDGVLTYVEDE